MLKILSLFLMITKPFSLNIYDYLNSLELNLRVDPIFSEFQISNLKEEKQNKFDSLALMTQSLPLRLIKFSDFYYVNTPSYPFDKDSYNYQTTIIFKRSYKLSQKLKQTGGYFLKNKLSWQITEKYLWLNLSQEKEFSLENHLEAHKLLVKELGILDNLAKINFSLKDYLSLQKDIFNAGFSLPMPSLTPMAKVSDPLKF